MRLTARSLESLCNNSVVRGDTLRLVNLFFKSNRRINGLNLQNAVFKGNLDFGVIHIGNLRIDHCRVEGMVSGTITYKEIWARHPNVWYWNSMYVETLASSQLAEFFAHEGY